LQTFAKLSRDLGKVAQGADIFLCRIHAIP
jgi:hypothetical protein